MITTFVRTIEYTIDENIFKKVHHLKEDKPIDFEDFLEIIDEDAFSFYDSGGIKYNDKIFKKHLTNNK